MAGSGANHILQYTAIIDGAGAYGEYPHSPYEYIDIDKTFERAVIALRELLRFVMRINSNDEGKPHYSSVSNI
jgi:di/tripeptidase